MTLTSSPQDGENKCSCPSLPALVFCDSSQTDPENPNWVRVLCGHHRTGDLRGKNGGVTATSRSQEKDDPWASSRMVVQFCGWELQSAVSAVREYVYVNSPFTSTKTYSASTISWNFPACHLGRTHRAAGAQGGRQPRGLGDPSRGVRAAEQRGAPLPPMTLMDGQQVDAAEAGRTGRGRGGQALRCSVGWTQRHLWGGDK